MSNRKLWEELQHGEYVYVRRNKDELIVSACVGGKSMQTEVPVRDLRCTPTDLVIVAARRVMQRLKDRLTPA